MMDPIACNDAALTMNISKDINKNKNSRNGKSYIYEKR